MDNQETSTFFSVHQVAFPQPVDSKIRTDEFLTASRSLLNLLDTLGKVFTPARYDMNGNIEKIAKKYNEDKSKNEYLEEMLLAEKKEGKLFAIDALMWLRRGLHFMLEFFEAVANDVKCQEDLSSFVQGAYSATLQKYHGWFGGNLFGLLSRLVPQRKLLFKYMALDKENCEEYVLRDLKEDNGLESDAKV